MKSIDRFGISILLEHEQVPPEPRNTITDRARLVGVVHLFMVLQMSGREH